MNLRYLREARVSSGLSCYGHKDATANVTESKREPGGWSPDRSSGGFPRTRLSLDRALRGAGAAGEHRGACRPQWRPFRVEATARRLGWGRRHASSRLRLRGNDVSRERVRCPPQDGASSHRRSFVRRRTRSATGRAMVQSAPSGPRSQSSVARDGRPRAHRATQLRGNLRSARPALIVPGSPGDDAPWRARLPLSSNSGRVVGRSRGVGGGLASPRKHCRANSLTKSPLSKVQLVGLRRSLVSLGPGLAGCCPGISVARDDSTRSMLGVGLRHRAADAQSLRVEDSIVDAYCCDRSFLGVMPPTSGRRQRHTQAGFPRAIDLAYPTDPDLRGRRRGDPNRDPLALSGRRYQQRRALSSAASHDRLKDSRSQEYQNLQGEQPPWALSTLTNPAHLLRGS